MALTKSGGKKTGSSFLKTGAAATQLYESEEAKAEQRKEEQGKLWRFFITKDEVGEDVRITFLDGDLTDDGMIDCPVWREHTVYHNGRWQNYIAIPEEDGPDPISETEGKEPAFVFGLTVIDHREAKSKKGDKVYKDRKKLFVGKRKTMAVLMKIAQKRGGLAGCVFDVVRSNDDAANVGDLFQFVEKRDLKDLQTEFGDQAIPADFEEELTYYDRTQLMKMGFGPKAGSAIGGGKPSKDYASEL